MIGEMPNGKELKIQSKQPNAKLDENLLKQYNLKMRSNSNISLPKLKGGRNRPTIDTSMANNTLGYDAFFKTP